MTIGQRKEKRPAFLFYPKDFMTDGKVVGMSAEARGVYIWLLGLDWLEDGIPADPRTWLKVGGFSFVDGKGVLRTADDCQEVIASLRPCFIKHPGKPGYVTNPRLAIERERLNGFAEAGRRGAEKRWNSVGADSPPHSPPDRVGIAKAWLSSPSPSPNTTEQKVNGVVKKRGPACAPALAFDAFWLAYPKKAGKQDALRVWNRVAPSPDLVVKIMASLESHKRSDKWLRGFIKDASGWLNGRRWEDELELPQPSSNIPSAEETRRQMEEFA